jgi:hypothetical protein
MENQIAGHGRTVELNSEVIRLKSDRPLPARAIQLTLFWPATLPDGTLLNLWIDGTAVALRSGDIEICIAKHEFSHYGATNRRFAVTRITLRRGESSGAEPHTKGVGRNV